MEKFLNNVILYIWNFFKRQAVRMSMIIMVIRDCRLRSKPYSLLNLMMTLTIRGKSGGHHISLYVGKYEKS